MADLALQEKALGVEFKKIEVEREALDKTISEMDAAAAASAAAQSDLEDRKSHALPRITHAISLYACISGIKFKYLDGEAETLEGTIALPHLEEVRQFEVVVGGREKGELAREMWGMMENRFD